jgi:phospholipase C
MVGSKMLAVAIGMILTYLLLSLICFGVSNVEEGEKLAYRVYSAVRNSPDWDKTLLIIMFDEHGGCYDHVSPSKTVSPDGIVVPQSQPGGSGFTFDRLGVRIPAIIVSPFTRAGAIANDVFDHTTVLKTVPALGRVHVRLRRRSRTG